MNFKFSTGDLVYHKDVLYMITIAYRTMYEDSYVITEWANTTNSKVVYERELMSLSDWNKCTAGRQDISKLESELINKMNRKTCVCGAGAVKDTRHSSWCDIKN
jgi:hypothetical protein